MYTLQKSHLIGFTSFDTLMVDIKPINKFDASIKPTQLSSSITPTMYSVVLSHAQLIQLLYQTNIPRQKHISHTFKGSYNDSRRTCLMNFDIQWVQKY